MDDPSLLLAEWLRELGISDKARNPADKQLSFELWYTVLAWRRIRRALFG